MANRILALFSCMIACGISAAELYVDCNTSPAGDGSKGAPYATIQQAANQVNPGDTVIIMPGVYFESVRLKRFGQPGKPITFRADKTERRRVILSGADPSIRNKKVQWTLADAENQIYSVPYSAAEPSRVLYNEVDLYPYRSLDALKKLEATPGVPGPRHGFVQAEGKLFVRLRQDGKYGSVNPNHHVMAVAPSSKDKLDKNGTRAFNFGLLGGRNRDLHVILDGITFETPGVAAVYVDGNHVVIRNALFLGCWMGGVRGKIIGKTGEKTSADVTLEFCEFHNFPVYRDVQELLSDVKSGKRSVDPQKERLYWWIHKSRLNGAVTPYEYGIASGIGKSWTIRNSYIHDAFEAVANSDGDHMIFEDNLCERLIDNGFELENHGRHCHIRRNYFIDIFQPISMQPLCGHPWPGPNYVYQNVFYRTPEERLLKGSTFKIGIQKRMWGNKKYPYLQGDSWKHQSIPGLLIFNNTIIEPDGVVFADLEKDQKIDNISFCNNLVVAPSLGWASRKKKEDGNGFYHFSYSGNRMAIFRQPAGILPSSAADQLYLPEQVLPEWEKNRLVPEEFELAAPVKNAPLQFRYVGAFQSPNDSFADNVGVQETRE